MSDDEYGLCEYCGHDLSDRASHYHCTVCGELCSMMGHNDCVQPLAPGTRGTITLSGYWDEPA